MNAIPMADILLDRDAIARVRRPLTDACSLPPEAYTDDAVFRREIEQVFRAGWLCAGRVEQLPRAGSYHALDLLGEKLVMVRDKHDAIHVLSRVCRHRAAEVVTGSGRTGALVCPYHAWSYRHDGTLHAAPLMDGARGFCPADAGLRRYRSETWEGWIFVNLDNSAADLGPQLAPLARKLANYRMSDMVATAPIEFPSAFNWKVLVDNFMEAYHHIAIHRDTFEPVFPARCAYVPDNQGPYSVLHMPAGGGAAAGELPQLPVHGQLNEQEASELRAVAVFPCHLFVPGAESLTWYHLLPESVDRFRLLVYNCFPRATLDAPEYHDAIARFNEFVTHVHQEDIVACEAVWRGVTAPGAQQGRLSPLEGSLWQFNQWWLAQME